MNKTSCHLTTIICKSSWAYVVDNISPRNAGNALGTILGLPLPRVEPIEVSEWLIEHTSELSIELGGTRTPWKPGTHLASLYVDDPGKKPGVRLSA